MRMQKVLNDWALWKGCQKKNFGLTDDIPRIFLWFCEVQTLVLWIASNMFIQPLKVGYRCQPVEIMLANSERKTFLVVERDEMHFFLDSCNILTRTCKIMHYPHRILQDLTKNNQSWKILADKAFIDCWKNCVVFRILTRFILSTRILQEMTISAWIFEKFCISQDLKILQDMYFCSSGKKERSIEKGSWGSRIDNWWVSIETKGIPKISWWRLLIRRSKCLLLHKVLGWNLVENKMTIRTLIKNGSILIRVKWHSPDLHKPRGISDEVWYLWLLLENECREL